MNEYTVIYFTPTPVLRIKRKANFRLDYLKSDYFQASFEKYHNQKVTKIIPELREFDYETRLRKLNLWSLEKRRNHADIIEVFKMLNGFSAVPFETFIQLDLNTRNRGHTAKIKKNRCRTY